jgi:hypothetical protein
MAGTAEARAWWADVEDVREKIERRRAREQRTADGDGISTPGRGVREVRSGRRLTLVTGGGADPAPARRRRPRPRTVQRIGPHPDRIAAWAVALGVMLVLAAILSAH